MTDVLKMLQVWRKHGMVEQAHSQGCCNCGCSNRGQDYDGEADEFLGAAAIRRTPNNGGMGAKGWQWLPTLTGC